MADAEDADGSPADPPDRPSVGGRLPLPPEKSAYEKWWAAYRSGARSPRVLAREHKVSIHTIRFAVRYGWPAAGMLPLADRAAEWDRQLGAKIQETAKGKEEQAQIAIAELVTDDWQQAARGFIAENQRLRGGVATLVTKLVEQLPTLKWDEIDARGAAAMLRLLVAAVKDAAGVTRALYGSLDPGSGAGRDIPGMSQEQLDQLRAGELPRDLSDEQLAAALLEATRMAEG